MAPEYDQIESAALQGDVDAFVQLVQLWDVEFRSVVATIVKSRSATEDVMQNGYERAFRSLRSFEGRSTLKTWMHSIFYRAAIDFSKHEARRAHQNLDKVDQQTLIERTPVGEAVSARLEVEHILQGCTAPQKAMLMLTVGLGYTFDETASILGIKRGTVASTVSRLRDRLRLYREGN